MHLERIDWIIIGAFFAVALVVGLVVTRRAGRNVSEFFLSGRSMPWWLLGMSMVATTFSTDTPNLVTDIVRQHGVAGNWMWWAFLLTGMLTVFIYARLWRRSGVVTDVEFYELRYSGRTAAFLRGFRAVYLGLFFNVVVMATVTLAAIKIGRVMFDFSPMQTILLASVVTVVFSALGGLRAVLLTDFLLFIIAMIGAIAAAVVALRLPEVGGLEGLLNHENLQGKLSIVPAFENPDGSSNMGTLVTLLVIPLAVQWWSVWYPGAEPGGGGYLAQRMLSAKDEKNAIGATLFFNAAHYALRPWPWIIVALCSLVVFPDLAALQSKFPSVEQRTLGHDLAYPAMLTFLPAGLLGLVVASLIAAYMSTISTHLNWGSSYLVNDFWKRFISTEASQRELVWVGRACTVLLMIVTGALALLLENALQAFNILLQIGAGTGLLFILRWFWWRINAISEITAMVVSFLVALFFFMNHRLYSLITDALMATGLDAPTAEAVANRHLLHLEPWQELIAGVAITTVCWVLAALFTVPADTKTLRDFYKLTRPGGPGWRGVIDDARRDGEEITGPERGRSNLPAGILCMVVGCFAVYSALFATGYWLYGQFVPAAVLTAVAVAASAGLILLWGRVTGDDSETSSTRELQ